MHFLRFPLRSRTRPATAKPARHALRNLRTLSMLAAAGLAITNSVEAAAPAAPTAAPTAAPAPAPTTQLAAAPYPASPLELTAAPRPASPVQLVAAAGKPARSGASVYSVSCASCHTYGMRNAPKLTDKAAWAPRLAQPPGTLTAHVLKGLGWMPPRGTCSACSDEEIQAAVDYMVSRIPK